jgi:ubiquinone/menaquinone biosynthesis C-methylase UbiE
MPREPIPKPAHLSPEFASQFQDPSVARAYMHRPPYPADLFSRLAALIGPRPRKVLDLGTGTGAVARGIASLVDQVDAVDISLPLLQAARSLAGASREKIRWIHGLAEAAPLNPPYGLATAGSSLHWMDCYAVLPRVQEALAPGAVFAILEERTKPSPWSADLNTLIPKYSTNKAFRPYRLRDELAARGLFKPVGYFLTSVMTFSQPIDEHIESMHARNGFSRDRMTREAAAEFDWQFRSLLERHCPHGTVHIDVFTEVVYGDPARLE